MMWLFFFGFAAGAVSVLAAIFIFISYAISEASPDEKSIADTIPEDYYIKYDEHPRTDL